MILFLIEISEQNQLNGADVAVGVFTSLLSTSLELSSQSFTLIACAHGQQARCGCGRCTRASCHRSRPAQGLETVHEPQSNRPRRERPRLMQHAKLHGHVVSVEEVTMS